MDDTTSMTHVETVVLLSKGEVDSKKIRVEFSLEDMDMSEFQDGATYPQITTKAQLATIPGISPYIAHM